MEVVKSPRLRNGIHTVNSTIIGTTGNCSNKVNIWPAMFSAIGGGFHHGLCRKSGGGLASTRQLDWIICSSCISLFSPLCFFHGLLNAFCIKCSPIFDFFYCSVWLKSCQVILIKLLCNFTDVKIKKSVYEYLIMLTYRRFSFQSEQWWVPCQKYNFSQTNTRVEYWPRRLSFPVASRWEQWGDWGGRQRGWRQQGGRLCKCVWLLGLCLSFCEVQGCCYTMLVTWLDILNFAFWM